MRMVHTYPGTELETHFGGMAPIDPNDLVRVRSSLVPLWLTIRF